VRLKVTFAVYKAVASILPRATCPTTGSGNGNVVATKIFCTDIFDDEVKYAYMSLMSAKILHYICAVVTGLPRHLCLIKVKPL